jgi:general stress protein YciG
MPGTIEGAAKASNTNKERYGADYYKRIGKIGGNSPKTKPSGFAAMPRAFRIAAGRKGGAVSRRRSRAEIEEAEGNLAATV